MFRSSVNTASRKVSVPCGRFSDCHPNFRSFRTWTPAYGWFRETTLTQCQRAQLFAGKFPADFSGEVIRINTSFETHRRFHKVFALASQRSAPLLRAYAVHPLIPSGRSEKPHNVVLELEVEGPRWVTVIRSKMSPLHRSMVAPLSFELDRHLPGWGIVLGRNSHGEPQADIEVWQPSLERGRPQRLVLAVDVAFNQLKESVADRVETLLEKYSTAPLVVIISMTESDLHKPAAEGECLDVFRWATEESAGKDTLELVSEKTP